MSRSLLTALLCLWSLSAADVKATLEAVERRYNNARTLQVNFEETYLAPGRGKRTEAGVLYLRKPGRMRWDYTRPPGKLFLSDGKDVYLYTPYDKQVEKMKLKEADDLRAPLAFLLGRLNFDKEFEHISGQTEPTGIVVKAQAKSTKLPYKNVEFHITPDLRMDRIVIYGQDESVLQFEFSDEKLNPPLAESLFRFALPPGARMVEAAAVPEP